MARKKNKDKDQEHELREEDSKVLKWKVGKREVDITYTVNKQHRRHLNEKSYWDVKPKEEYECFEISFQNCWLTLPNKDSNGNKTEGMIFGVKQVLPTEAFGILVVDGKAKIIGKTRYDKEGNRHDSYFARFEYDANTNHLQWHGFIADPYNVQREIPDDCYLKYWLQKKYIKNSMTKKFISK